MAFPDGWQRKCAIVIQAAQVAETLTDFPMLVTGDNLPAEIWANADDGGGDLRFSADDAGAVRLACEIVSFSTSGETAEIYIKVPSVSSAVNTSIWIWYNNTGQTQPAATDTYGSQAVWGSDYAAVYHFNQNPAGGTLLDSTANGNHGIINGTISLQNGVVGQNSAHRLEIGDYISFTAIPMNATQTIDMVIAKTGGTNQSGIIHGSSNFMGIRANLLAYSSLQNVSTAAAILTTSFKNVIYTRLSTDAGKFYDNGALVSSNIFNEGKAYISSINGFGWDYELASDRFFEGSFDEIRLVNTFYSENYAESQYNNMFNPATFAIAGTPTAVSAFNPAWAKHSNQIIRAL